MSREKILNFPSLLDTVQAARAGGLAKVVHCHGVFDLLHIGHIRYLEQAKRSGDLLVVTLTQDIHVDKGPHRPAFTEQLRAEALAALHCVDFVAINDTPTAVGAIAAIKPDYYAKGAEYQINRTEEIIAEEQAVTAACGQMLYVEDLTSSSTLLINRHLDVFPDEVRDYLAEFRTRHSAGEVLAALESIKPLKVLVLGETIIDEYQVCESIGKSSKAPALVAKYISTETFAGGVLAVGNHIAGFAEDVKLLTFLGARDSAEDFVRGHLQPGLELDVLYLKDAPTIVKRRFLDNYLLTKFFEVYIIEDRDLDPAEDEALCARLEQCIDDYDLVVVSDFGHGMMSGRAIEIVSARARFLAVNAQVNAGNKGFNTFSKYPRADFICCNETEIRTEMRAKQAELKKLMRDMAAPIGCDQLIVTRGKFGNLCYSREEGFREIPAFANRVVDRVGAGDAVFALTAMCACKAVPVEITGFIGNAVGAEAVATLGNQRSVEMKTLQRTIRSLLAD